MSGAARSALARASWLCVPLLLTLARNAAGRDLWSTEDGSKRLSLESALKSSLLGQDAEGTTLGTSLWRARAGLVGEVDGWLNARIDYEHRARLDNGAGAFESSVLALTNRPPFRVTELDWSIARESTFEYRHEIDRALVSAHVGDWQLTLGRQAIGLGRGQIFGALDVFAPFQPTEIDREWRRGVDAVRAEWAPIPELAVDATWAPGPSLDEGALLGQARLVLGDFEAGLLGGKRGGDAMLGGMTSVRLGGSELHLEEASFLVDRAPGAPGEGRRAIHKLVAGGSHSLDIGRGVLVTVEYHYNGFGIDDFDAEAAATLQDPAWLARFERGDFQLLGRHALGATAQLELLDELSMSLTWLQSPADGSGVLFPTLTYLHAENAVLVLSAFAGWGPSTRQGIVQSEYGSFPASGLIQIRLYD